MSYPTMITFLVIYDKAENELGSLTKLILWSWTKALNKLFVILGEGTEENPERLGWNLRRMSREVWLHQENRRIKAKAHQRGAIDSNYLVWKLTSKTLSKLEEW